MISLRRFRAMTVARSLEFLRDRSALGWNILVPLFMLGGMGFIFSGPGQPLFKVAVVADAPLDGALHPFLATPHVQFYAEDSPDVALPKLQRHRVDLLLDLRATPGRYWINETSPKSVTLDRMLAGTEGPRLLRETTQGEAIRYVDWLVPGILGMNMMFSCLFGVGYVIVRYRKSGYLKRLNATPLHALEFILAQLISRLALILLITVAVFAGCHALFGFRMDGRFLDLFLVTALGAFSMIAMGLIISARVTSEELAGGLLNLLSFPMMILSGVFFSLDGAPPLLQGAAQIFPLTHLIDAARAIMLDGAGLADLGYPISVMAGISVFCVALGTGFFKWTQD
jgi:ABC-2 type transport system permease protein